MIKSTKNYTKKEKKGGGRQTLGQMVKAKLYRQNYTQKHIYTHSQKQKKENIYISLLPMSTASIWDDSLSIEVFHRCRVHQVDCGDLIHCS